MDATGGTAGNAASGDEAWPLTAELLTAREREFFAQLRRVCPGYLVFCQVSLGQLIKHPEDHPQCFTRRNRYAQKVADFVLAREDFSGLLVIELDDARHRWSDRQEADQIKDFVVRCAGLRMVRIPAGPLPTDDRLAQMLALGGAESPTQDSSPLQVGSAPRQRVQMGDSPFGATSALDALRKRQLLRLALPVLLLGALLVLLCHNNQCTIRSS